ncbi:AAA family ATPase [Arthrobacter sp. AZCC_0090]|uniref:AAA family ATPase n=1 Tax=Arthrobacter sp. AZCC_0090 TaxID=2735881 RepID=UPI00160D895E|nr:SMC family ATPase [Arthrobacter sp. AZCC_0090]MBB6404065.1 exonuclease SbcC [Arthrobacter sp. AZCC_0090]
MRIHHLEIEAFGPFAKVQSIDFDQLGAQGLFLLNGATGAGKTSVLDAICFALYGSVPGARQDGKRLRSDHAEPAAEPRVVCEFSARGRRFEVTRSPAWDRPSARGRKGFTTQQAKTLLRERVNGSWEEKTSRNDEAGAEIGDVLGMDREQFTRVVMLPQGDFAAFLRSKASDRLDLLQKLFGTQRFEAIEQQLAFQAITARAAVQDNQNGLHLLLQRAESEFAQLGIEESVDPEVLDVKSGVAAPELRLGHLEAWARAESAERHQVARSADIVRLRLADKLNSARERVQRHAKLDAAMLRHEALSARAAEVQEVRDRLGRHRKAAVLGGQLDAVDRAAKALDLAGSKAEAATAKLLAASLDASDPAVALAGVQETTAVLEARVGDEQKLEDITARLVALDVAAGGRDAAKAARSIAVAGLRAEAAALEAGLGPLEAAALELPLRESEAAAAQNTVKTVARRTAALESLSAAVKRHAFARALSQDLRQLWLDLRESRLANAAAELAAKLHDGDPCPVCGSVEHPSPAPAGLTALALAEKEQSAHERYDESEHELLQAAAELASAEQEVAVLAAQGGDIDPKEAASAEASANDALASARSAVEILKRGKEDLTRTKERIARLEDEQLQEDTAAAQAESTIAVLGEQRESLDSLLSGLRDGFDTLRARIEALAGQRVLLQFAVTAGAQLESARQALDDASTALEHALSANHFETAEDARREILDEQHAARFDEVVRASETESARLAELFESEDLVLAAKESQIGEVPLSAVELAALEQEAGQAEEAARRLALAAGLAARTVESLATIRSQYEEAAASGREPRERARVLSELAETARGSGDNGYKMSLNSYVLAARLEQVAAAASERLVAMSDGRYTLQHTDAKAARGAKSGLGLEVVDEWTGQRRDTATLSGGESFMASLALALGLADVVQQEAGGVDIETLFVDEGFGSLDEQSLEQVMDALEGLRDGGRVVGLVSHVAEMKQRISSQLQVIKSRNGSIVRIVDAVAA